MTLGPSTVTWNILSVSMLAWDVLNVSKRSLTIVCPKNSDLKSMISTSFVDLLQNLTKMSICSFRVILLIDSPNKIQWWSLCSISSFETHRNMEKYMFLHMGNLFLSKKNFVQYYNQEKQDITFLSFQLSWRFLW